MDFSRQFICASEAYSSYRHFVPAPYFRKVFTADAEDARLRVTGLGFYRVWINGREITKGLLAPYISNPDDLVYFDDYDLSPYLHLNAENVLGFQLGNGMLNAPGGATWDFDKAPFRAAPKHPSTARRERSPCAGIGRTAAPRCMSACRTSFSRMSFFPTAPGSPAPEPGFTTITSDKP
ncbi:MAG: alpha-L-rhamnosidase N-terminal domain-containing protein [Clostridia bacterium]|nr:alpha-L-rhamnosidase N-terminal domain-containing protein [Clostridia bacterium]